MNPDDYCAQRAAPGSSLHYSLMFLPPAKRRAATVVHALAHELQEITDAIHDPGVAHTKLEWWHQEMLRLFQGTPRHPVTQAFLPLMATHHFSQEQLVQWLANVTEAVERARFDTFDALYRHCLAVNGIPQQFAARLYGATEEATYRYAEKLGAALRLPQLLARVGEDVRRQRLTLPTEDLRRYGIVESDLFNYRHTPPLEAFMAEATQRVLAYFDDALAQLPAMDRTHQLPGLVACNIARALLDEMRRDGFRVLQHRVALTPLRKLWIAWRTRLSIRFATSA